MLNQSRLCLIGLAAGFLAGPPSVSAQPPKAAAWLVACDQGTARDCYELGKGYRGAKEGLQSDRPKAVQYYAKACELGLAAACQELGEALVVQGAPGALGPDSLMALAVLGRGCELEPQGKAGRTAGLVGGRGRCQGVVALYQKIHPRTRADSVTAKRIVRMACERADDKAACVMLSAGWANFPDSVAVSDSIKRLRADAEARDREQRELARARDSARITDSVAQADRERAQQDAKLKAAVSKVDGRASARLVALRRTLRGACLAGEAKACADLAEMFERGRGGPQDRAQAATFRQKACGLDPSLCRKP